MAGNDAFEMVREQGWRRGYANLVAHEFTRWWKTRMWWTHSLIWIAVIGFMLAAVMFGGGEATGTDGKMIYAVFAGLFPAVGVVILAQGILVGEKKDGTAAWVMSKPASRPAFILSKVVANSLGILATMVVLPGLVAYIIFTIADKAAPNPLAFLAALGVIFLHQLFYLTLTIMLGSLFTARGPVIGIGLALLFLQQYLVGLLPPLRYILPWTLVIPLNGQNEAVVPALLLGQPLSDPLQIVLIALECVLFTCIAVWRFNQEEL